MRVSSDPASDSYFRNHFVGLVRVTLDGEPMRYVVEADDEAGFLIRHIRDKNGRFRCDGHELLTERLEGRIEITGDRIRAL